MSEVFTPLVSCPRWLCFSTLPATLGAPTWTVFQTLCFTLSRLINMTDERWAVENEFAYFRVRVKTEIPEQTGLSRRSVQRAMQALERARLIDIERGDGREFTRVRFNEDTICAIARYCMPRLPGYRGGIAGRTPVPRHVSIFLGHNLGWPHETAVEYKKQAEGAAIDAAEVRQIIINQGGRIQNYPFG